MTGCKGVLLVIIPIPIVSPFSTILNTRTSAVTKSIGENPDLPMSLNYGIYRE